MHTKGEVANMDRRKQATTSTKVRLKSDAKLPSNGSAASPTPRSPPSSPASSRPAPASTVKVTGSLASRFRRPAR